MRIYLPATLDQIEPAAGPLTPRRVHAVTPALRAMFPDEDDEGLEFAAQLAAADDSLALLGELPGAPRARLVVSVDVSEDDVRPLLDDDEVPSALDLLRAVDRDDIACVHVDEPGVGADVDAAITGDDAAIERLDERDLLWYDASELGQLSAIPR